MEFGIYAACVLSSASAIRHRSLWAEPEGSDSVALGAKEGSRRHSGIIVSGTIKGFIN